MGTHLPSDPIVLIRTFVRIRHRKYHPKRSLAYSAISKPKCCVASRLNCWLNNVRLELFIMYLISSFQWCIFYWSQMRSLTSRLDYKVVVLFVLALYEFEQNNNFIIQPRGQTTHLRPIKYTPLERGDSIHNKKVQPNIIEPTA